MTPQEIVVLAEHLIASNSTCIDVEQLEEYKTVKGLGYE